MSQISNATATDTALRSAPANGFSEMETDDFIRIIFTELTNQDPLQPNDTSALLEQLNSIRTIESDISLTKQLKSLVTENQLASASNMIGKFIGGLSDGLDRVGGFVVSAIKQGDAISLELDDGTMVPIDNVETIIDPSLLVDPTTTQPAESGPAAPPDDGAPAG